MMMDSVLEVLSCGMYLTAYEIAKLIQVEEQSVKKILVQNEAKIVHRCFAGKEYYQYGGQEIKLLGQKALNYLENRSYGKNLHDIRTCNSHLGGKVAVHLFQKLRESQIIYTSDELSFELTSDSQKFLDLHEECFQVETHIDFSERQLHLSGKLGKILLEQLVTGKIIEKGENREVKLIANTNLQNLSMDKISSLI